MSDESTEKEGWQGRRPKGEQDTHSWKAFLAKTPNKALQEHLRKHHRGMKAH